MKLQPDHVFVAVGVVALELVLLASVLVIDVLTGAPIRHAIFITSAVLVSTAGCVVAGLARRRSDRASRAGSVGRTTSTGEARLLSVAVVRGVRRAASAPRRSAA